MKFAETRLKDAFTIELEENSDQRGFFARTYCANEFDEHGISFKPVQANLSFNHEKHTLRGMHYQNEPDTEAKLVYCVKGSIYDVIIDLRPESGTYTKWVGFELNDDNRRMLYVPKGFAHGFLTLEEQTEVAYLMSDFYKPGAGKGIRWDDSLFNIDWPEEVTVISMKDKQWPAFVRK